jgi:hypothetical protein
VEIPEVRLPKFWFLKDGLDAALPDWNNSGNGAD